VGVGKSAQLAQLAMGLVIRVADLQWTHRTKEHLINGWGEHKGGMFAIHLQPLSGLMA